MSNPVSITELTPDVHPHSDDVTEGNQPLLWDMDLPGDIDAERITVDMKRLRRIHAAGDIAASFVEGYKDAESEEISAGVCTDPFDCYLAARTVSLNATFGRPAVTHQINEATLTDRAQQQLQATDVTPEKIWADLYDEAVRSSMVQAARQSLIGRREKVPYPLNVTSYALTVMGFAGLVSGLAGALSGEGAVFEMGVYTAAQAAPQMIRKSRTKGGEMLPRRVSVVPMNRQPDRYALTWALCKKSGLVSMAP